MVKSYNTYIERKQKIDLTETVYNLYKADKIRLPLLGNVACGEPIYVDEDIVLSGEELNKVKELGKAIAFQSDVI